MSVQNPNIPSPTQAKAIDAVIYDLQMLLDTSLSWLTNGMGRAYRLTKVRTDQTTVFLPEVYLGTAQNKYFAATPDNDKQGQNVFFVGDATLPDQQKGFYGWVEHEVGIIFNANLELIDSTLLLTEDFTEHLIQDVREVLIRDLVGKPYRLNIDSITREFDDVYAEFDVSRERGVAHAPLTHFRVNCTITFKEDCQEVSLDRCAAILQNLSTDDKLNCILPTYDFSTTAVQNATTAQQQSDMIDWLCVTPASTPKSMLFDGTTEKVQAVNDVAYSFEYNTPFTISAFVKITSNKTHNLINKFDNAIVNNERGFYTLILSDRTLRLLLTNKGTTNVILIQSNSNAISLNTWHRLDFVYNGTPTAANCDIYVDGIVQTRNVLFDTLGTNTIQNTTPLQIASTVNNLNSFAGYLHEVQLRNIALNATEIANDRQAILDFNNGVSSSYTPVQNASMVFRNKMGADALYGVYDWVFPDESGTVSGSQSVLMEFADRTNDIPL